MTIPGDTLQKMGDTAKAEPDKLLKFWQELTQLERHEDSLINNRLQAFLVTTAFLVGAFSQFRDSNGIAAFMRTFIAAFGIALALIMRHVLKRTATAIEWYLERLIALDQLIFDEGLRPYETRRKEKHVQPKVQVSRILSVYLPTSVVALWGLVWLCSLWPVVVMFLKRACG
jgi:hypothetical protein